MNSNGVQLRKANPEDARGWYTLVNRVWRDTYHHIFPEEVFLEKENNLEKRIPSFKEWLKNDSESITYVKENQKARRVYEAWGGKLSESETAFVKHNVAYPEVFYTFRLKSAGRTQ